MGEQTKVCERVAIEDLKANEAKLHAPRHQQDLAVADLGLIPGVSSPPRDPVL